MSWARLALSPLAAGAALGADAAGSSHGASSSTAGAGARATEAMNRLLGTEKEPTALRQEYLRMRNTAVLDMLPPGVASDKDIELALAAFPTETSSPANIAGFLRGMAKLQTYESAINNAQAEWIQQNGTLGVASTEMQVGNRTVQRGDRFTDFVKVYIPNTSVLGGGGQSGATFGAVTGATPASGGTTGTATPANASANLAAMKALALQRFPNEAAQINAITSEDAFKSAYKRTYEMWQEQQNTADTTTVEVDY